MPLTVIPPSGLNASANFSFSSLTVNANLQTANFTATAVSNLGPVGNVIITGGSSGQVLSTNGSGNLSWISVSTSSISSGNSNVNIPAANGNVNISAAGNANIAVVTGTGVNVAGTLNVTGNANAGNIGATGGVFTTVAGSLTTASQPNITAVGTLGTLTVTGNITAGNANLGNNVSANFFTGNGIYLTGITTAGVSNGNSNVNIPAANGNINLSAAGNANVLVVTGTGANIAGTLNATGNANVGNIGATGVVATTVSGSLTTAAQPNITSVGTLSSLTVSGNISGGNLLGPLANGNSNVNIPAANGNVNISAAGNANVLVVTGTGVNVAGVANVTGNLTANTFIAGSGSGGNLTNANVISANTGNFSAGLNVSGVSNLGPVGNVIITGGSSGQVLSTNGSGNLSWVSVSTSSISNGNSNVNIPAANGNITLSASGNANVLVVTGTGINVAGTSNITGNLTANTFIAGNGSGGNLTNANVISANTGNFSANLITGGNLNVSGNAVISGNLTVNGNLTYVNVTDLAVSDPIIQLQTGANGAAPTSNSGKDVGTALNYYDTSAKIAWMGWDVSNAEIAFGANVGIASEVVTFTALANIRAGNAQLGNLAVANFLQGTLTTASQPNITSLGTLSSLAATGNITAGNVYANSGTIGAGSLTGTLTTASQPNITSLGTLTGLTVSGTSNLGPVGNVIITGGSNGQVLTTNGSGNLSWTTVSGGGGGANIANGNSNVNIASANGNVTVSVAGNANVVTFTGTGANIAGTLQVSGISNLGPVGNVRITGGNTNQVLTTDGAGNLSWTNSTQVTAFSDTFTGNGVQTTFTLSTTPANINLTYVNYNGALMQRSSYSLSGANLVLSSAPANGSTIEVTTMSGFTTQGVAYSRTNATATASQTTFNVVYAPGYLQVYYNGVLLAPSDYTATNGTTVVLADPATAGDLVEFVAFTTATTSVAQPATLNSTTLNSNLAITAGYSAVSVGPISIANGVSVTIADGQKWVIL
jgi:hypothetical protein